METPDEWPKEWVEMAWAARDASAAALNAQRRQRFDSIKRAIGESHRNNSHTKYIPPERGGVLKKDGNFETNKPWEIVVGQAIAQLKMSAPSGQNGLRNFLGPKIFSALKLHP